MVGKMGAVVLDDDDDADGWCGGDDGFDFSSKRTVFFGGGERSVEVSFRMIPLDMISGVSVIGKSGGGEP